MQQCQGENSYPPVSCFHASIILHSGMQGVIWRKVGSGSGGLRAFVNHLELGLSMPEHEHGPLFLLNTSMLHQILPRCLYFPLELHSAPPCSQSGREDMADFFTCDTRALCWLFWLWFFYLWFFHSLLPAHIGILVAGYTARVLRATLEILTGFCCKIQINLPSPAAFQPVC